MFTITGALLSNLAFSTGGGASTQIAVDILGTTGTGGKTGLVGGTPLNPVPLPGAAWLFGTALVGMTVLGRRRRNRDVNATA